MAAGYFARALLACALVLTALTPAGASHSPPSPALRHTAAGLWTPGPGTTWQWQLQGTVNTAVDAQVFDIDLFNNDASVVQDLHGKGRKAICYFEAGAWEPYRPDSSRFPDSVKGNVYREFPDERWLDIRRMDVLGPIIEARLDLCKDKGFDGVEFDNMDGYQNNTGFPLTAQDQLTFNRWLAALAHSRGLSAGLKNDPDQAGQLAGDFEFEINEQCVEYAFCDQLTPFVDAGKAVFDAEYNVVFAAICPVTNLLRFSAIAKNVGLDEYRQTC